MEASLSSSMPWGHARDVRETLDIRACRSPRPSTAGSRYPNSMGPHYPRGTHYPPGKPHLGRCSSPSRPSTGIANCSPVRYRTRSSLGSADTWQWTTCACPCHCQSVNVKRTSTGRPGRKGDTPSTQAPPRDRLSTAASHPGRTRASAGPWLAEGATRGYRRRSPSCDTAALISSPTSLYRSCRESCGLAPFRRARGRPADAGPARRCRRTRWSRCRSG